MKTPAAVLYVRCVSNPVEDDRDGGVIRFIIHPPRPKGDILDAQLALSFRADEPMTVFPVTREEKQTKIYRLTLEEVTSDEMPTQAP